MRRLVLLFLTLFLPMQLVWAGAAAYCHHESGGEHFGHHEHVHKANQATLADVGDLAQDNDCGTCHAAGLSPLAAAVPVFADPRPGEAPVLQPARRPPAPPPHAPERPQWARLA
ncbi:hypothetical protein GCM10028796_02750 [Ramlibacter monticola]|uniref:Cobalt-zinc-cadmium resistance protein n=1 Tax=Ramlibacter monticola TaxID=1926872 RepID=A0A936YZB0_9BURK|nr:DUF2946 family protein [Ramlibacter monticola]MBL0391437.1 cobalt-zinc-cadmium resistance protein [Ramlibacter monticola]